MTALYDVRKASRFFTKGPTIVRAVSDVTLTIEPGEFVALEGPSGSGKTTLLQLLGALDRPSEGEVLLGGFLLAVVGGLLAGAAGALRAARLRPADALRTVE